MRVALWLAVIAALVLWMVANPSIGVLAGIVVLNMAADVFREQLDRFFRWVRREGVALAYDDPNYKPAVSATLWPPK